MGRPRRSLAQVSYVEPSDAEEEPADDVDADSDYGSDTSQSSALTDLADDPVNQTEDLVTVDLPNPEQISETNASLLVDEAQYEGLDAEYRKAQQAADAIKQKRDDLQRIMDEKRNFIAPVRRLPMELLGEIFALHVLGNGCSPWIPMGVSRLWRRAALGCPRMWSKISILRPVYGKQLIERNVEGRERCVSVMQLQRALKRSGVTRLDIELNTKAPRYDSFRKHGVDSKVLFEMVSLVCRELGRVERFSVTPKWGMSLPDGTFSGTFDSLRYLSLASCENIMSILPHIPTPGTLRTVELSSMTLSRFIDCKFWPHIEKLSIVEPPSYASSASLRSILEKSTNLTELCLRDVPNIMETMQLPSRLTVLEMTNVQHFWKIRAQSLVRLSITTCHMRMPEDFPSALQVSLPRLKYLKFVTFCSNAMRVFDMPLLETLDLSVQREANWRIDDGFSNIWKHPSKFPNPKLFILRGTNVSMNRLITTLRRFTQATELRLEGTRIQPTFFKDMGGADGIVLPKLEKLSVDYAGCAEMPEKEIKSAVTKMVKARNKAECGIGSVSVRFSYDAGWKEMTETAVST